MTLVIIRDVTERRLREQELDRLSHEDPLTGALNRRGFTELASDLLESARAERASVHLLVADVDRLKALNDEMGHEFGDHTLVAVAAALHIAHGPLAVVGRLGGDEFAVAVSGQADAEVEAATAGLRVALAQAKIGPEAIVRSVSVSIGVAKSEIGRGTIDELLAAADTNQYIEKRAQKRLADAAWREGLSPGQHTKRRLWRS